MRVWQNCLWTQCTCCYGMHCFLAHIFGTHHLLYWVTWQFISREAFQNLISTQCAHAYYDVLSSFKELQLAVRGAHILFAYYKSNTFLSSALAPMPLGSRLRTSRGAWASTAYLAWQCQTEVLRPSMGWTPIRTSFSACLAVVGQIQHTVARFWWLGRSVLQDRFWCSSSLILSMSMFLEEFSF